MMALGVLLLCLTGAFTGLAIADNLSGGPSYTITMLGNQIITLNTLAIFISGIVLALVFALGAWMVLGGATRARRHSAAVRSARREAAQAARERDRLAARLPDGEAPAAPATGTRPRHRMHLFGH